MTRRPAPPATPWRPPTRRAFVAMLGAAAATLAVGERARRRVRRATPAPAAAAKPLWIGHA